jgi:hypothetical protein
MSLHFLLKAEARTLSVVQVLAMSDDDAFALFRHLRWGGFEGLSAHYGAGAIIGEATRQALGDWRCRQLDEMMVGGRTTPVAIYGRWPSNQRWFT